VSPKDLLLTPSCDPSWLLVEEGVVLAREHEIEQAAIRYAFGTKGAR
jgi:hypothetical protein